MRTHTQLSGEDLETTEAELFLRVTAAKNAYQEAKARVTSLNRVALDTGLTHSDGALALRQALRIEREALDRYSDALKSFTDFVLRHKIRQPDYGVPPVDDALPGLNEK